MISQSVEYALRAVVAIALNQGQPCTAGDISKSTQVPAPYLSKLMQNLVRKGLAHSQRGWHGGYLLTKPPSEISIWEVVQAVVPIKRIHECPLGLVDHCEEMCSLHKYLDEATQSVETMFRSTTIDDILNKRDGATPLAKAVTPPTE